MTFSEEGDEDSFIVELLNAAERHGDGKLPIPDTLATPADIAWDDGGEYARAAEAAGVDVGGMLEAGANPKHLLEFVSNFRKNEGDKLGLLDKQKLKFATSQVLRKGPRVGHERSRRAPTPGSSSAWGFSHQEEAYEVPRRIVDRQPRRPRKRTSSNLGAGASARNGIESSHRTGDRTSPLAPLGEDDGVETARLCDELLRWSSALEGAERQLEGKGKGKGSPARVGNRTGGKSAHTQDQHVARAAPADDVVEKDSQQSAWTRETTDDEGFRSEEDDATLSERPHSRRVDALRHDRRRSDCGGGRDRNRSLSPEGVDYMDDGMDEREREPASSPGKRHGGWGTSSGHARPTPSYALPTKHFKTLDRDRRHALYAEDAHGQKQMQRQAHLVEENAALKLRLEGLRRAIHELEHQANTLREDARIREEEFSRLKKKLAITSSSTLALGEGKCPCCASTHQGRLRAVGDNVNGPSALKKRALAAEGRTQTLERCLRESKAKEQRSREIVASLKQNYSVAQAKAVGLEAELESTRKTLSEVRHELAESRRGAKGRLKDTRKQRRQQGEKERQMEIARAEASDLAGKLRKASREIERARLEAVEMRKEKARVEGESKDLARENRMLQDRLSDGKVRSRTRERDRWILAELRSESRSPPRRRTEAATRRESLTRDGFRTRIRNNGWRGRRLGVRDAPPGYASDSEPSVRSRSLSASPKAAVGEGRVEGAGGRMLPPRDARRMDSLMGRAGGAPGALGGAGRALSTRSADGADVPLDGGAGLRGSTLSGGSANGTMKARYERLQAMYRRVNRRDSGNRRRAGVG